LPWHCAGHLGRGCGLPGLKITVLDSNHKKAAFSARRRSKLKLANLAVCGERVEAWKPDAAVRPDHQPGVLRPA
jgi:16S rRNA G527 N7-methylase RsmG